MDLLLKDKISTLSARRVFKKLKQYGQTYRDVKIQFRVLAGSEIVSCFYIDNENLTFTYRCCGVKPFAVVRFEEVTVIIDQNFFSPA